MEESGQQDPPEGTSNDTEDRFQQPVANNDTIPDGGAVNLTSSPAAEAGQTRDEIADPEPTLQYPPAIGNTFVPFLVPPVLQQNSSSQPHQLNPNNMQMMIHNLLQQPAVAGPVSHGATNTTNTPSPPSQNTDLLQGSTNNQQALTENLQQPASMTAIQNLMRISSTQQQQQGSSLTNFPHFNMLQNLITSIPMQAQHVSTITQLPDSSQQQGDMSMMTSATVAQETESQVGGSQSAQQASSMMLPSLNSAMGMINTSQTNTQSAYPFQSLLKMNTNPVTTPAVPPGLWLAPPQYPGAIYGGMVLGAQPSPPQYGLAQPNPLVMQNLFTQMAAHHGTMAVAFPPTTSALLNFNPPADSLTASAPASAAATTNHQSLVNADLPENHSQKDRSGLPLPIYMEYDEETLTEYQCLLRKQIELFEAGPEDIKASAQGRNNPILLGQVGIRCRYCAALPLKSRPRGAVYYSKSIDGLYQVAQNMSKLHFCRTCKLIPKDTQQRLDHLQRVNRRAAGGKEYWAEGVRVLGVYEDGHVMRFRRSTARRKAHQEDDDHDVLETGEETTEPPRRPQSTLDTSGLTDDDDSYTNQAPRTEES